MFINFLMIHLEDVMTGHLASPFQIAHGSKKTKELALV